MERKVLVCLDEGGSEGLDALRVGFHLCDEGSKDSVLALSVVASADSKTPEQQKMLERVYTEELRKHATVQSDFVQERKLEHQRIAEILIRRSLDMKATVVVIGIDNKDHDSATRHADRSAARRGSLSTSNVASETILGAVADPLIRKSTVNVCVVPLRAARDVPSASAARRWMVCVDGSKMSYHGLSQLVSEYANETDEVSVLTLSRHDGKSDQAILAHCRELVAARRFAKLEVKWLKRDTQVSVGQQLCSYAYDNEFSFLCTSTGQSSMHRLGSTSTYCILHSKVCVFVFKTPSVDDVVVAERMSGDMFF
eukprot:TRINITY_DN45301_c0_g1_i1.p1 TRINITY_DN45301_c0_g1~~TRINITY_DN45301_c0_g1_i1.p1  ORF type:complete len:333 (+),score=91.53 TRINITY_DN45301_c0_g1_i1:66-1001(+)